MHKWTITTTATGKKRQVQVILYERLQDLRGAVTKYENKNGKSEHLDADVIAICHSFFTQKIGKKQEVELEYPLVNIIRLSREYLTPMIIAHEFAHAAQHIYGLDYLMSWKNPMNGANEEFAEIYGELFNAFWPMIHTQVTFKNSNRTTIKI